MDRTAEFSYIKLYEKENFFDSELICDQFRSLWTAYCLHFNLDPDTKEYTKDLLALWNGLLDGEKDNVFWSDFDSFDHFMSYYLV